MSPAPRNEQIDHAPRLHQRFGTLPRGILHDIDERLRKPAKAERGAHTVRNRPGGRVGLLSAPEHADVSAFQAERRGVGSDVGPAFVNDRHRAEGHGNPFNRQSVGAHGAFEHPADGIVQRRNRAHARRHGRNAGFGKRQTVEHHIGNMPLCPFQITAVRLQNFSCIRNQGVRHRVQRPVFLLRRQHRRRTAGRSRFP